MVRPAAVMSHSMRPRYKITAVLEEYIMHAGSFSRFRYMLLRFELTAAVSSSDYYCCHRPCEPVPGKVCGKDAADTTGFENHERSVSRLIYCMYLRVNFGGIRRLIPVVIVWLFGGMHETKNLCAHRSLICPPPTSCFNFLSAACRRKRFSSII